MILDALTRSGRARRALASAPVALLVLSGCAAFSPRQTDVPYQPADGVAVDLGDVEVRNLVLVAGEKDGPATVSAQVVNNGDKAETVEIASEKGGAPASVKVAPGQSTVLPGKGAQVQVDPGEATPGELATLTVSSTSTDGSPVEVPVVEADGYYKTLSPTSSPSAPRKKASTDQGTDETPGAEPTSPTSPAS